MSGRRQKHPGGRPSLTLSEARVLLPLPRALLDRATEAAKAEGVSRAEWIRRAVADRLLAALDREREGKT